MRVASLFVALIALSSPVLSQDNVLTLRGGPVVLEQITPAGGSSRWFLTLRVGSKELRAECTSTAAGACSAMSGTVPVLLNTGGCSPLYEATSTDSLGTAVHVWVCGGTGTGPCRVASGVVDESTEHADLVGKLTGLSACP